MERGTQCLYCLYCSTAADSDKLPNFFLLKMTDCGPTFLNFFKMADLIITEDFSRPGAVHVEENRRDDNDSWLGLD